ncbi:MAG: hypothetical protein R2726_09470 [Acidimicrobiales bacterium]
MALSPVRQQVQPEGVPAEPGDALVKVVRANAPRVPQVAARFGIEPGASRPRRPAAAKARPAPGPEAVESAATTEALAPAPVPEALDAGPTPAGALEPGTEHGD